MKKISSYSGKTKLYLESNSPNTIKNNLICAINIERKDFSK